MEKHVAKLLEKSQTQERELVNLNKEELMEVENFRDTQCTDGRRIL